MEWSGVRCGGSPYSPSRCTTHQFWRPGPWVLPSTSSPGWTLKMYVYFISQCSSVQVLSYNLQGSSSWYRLKTRTLPAPTLRTGKSVVHIHQPHVNFKLGSSVLNWNYQRLCRNSICNFHHGGNLLGFVNFHLQWIRLWFAEQSLVLFKSATRKCYEQQM